MDDKEKREQIEKRNKKIIDNFRDGHYLTVGRLKEAIKDLPDDGMVMYQRIEDVYFNNHHWNTSVILKEDETFEALETYDQYVIAWCSLNYDNENLYLTAHY
jgi:hypothetical protein